MRKSFIYKISIMKTTRKMKSRKRALLLAALLMCMVSAKCYDQKSWEVVRMAHDDQHLYLATAERGLVVIDKATGKQTFFNVDNGKLTHDWLNDIVVCDGKLYLTYRAIQQDNGGYTFPKDWIACVDLNEGTVSPFAFTDEDVAKAHKNVFYGMFLPRLFVDGDNNLWLTIADCYACKYDFAKEGITYVSGPMSLLGSSIGEASVVSDFRIDRQGNLWIAGGVPYIDEKGVLYRLTAETMAGGDYTMESLGIGFGPWDTASCMEIDGEGNVWVGIRSIMKENRLCRISSDGTWKRYPEEGNVPFVYSDIEKDDDGRLWVLTTDALYEVQGEQFVEVTCPFETGRRGQLHIDGDVLYMACEKGLYKYQDGGFTQMELPAGGHIGISQPEKPSAASQFFGVDGIQRTSLSKGLNIVRRDGSTGKVVVK